MSLTALKSQRSRYRASITSAFNFSNEIYDTTPSAELEVRISNLNEAWKQLQIIENQINELEDNADDENAVSSFIQYEEKYIQTHSRITTSLREKQEAASRQQTPAVTESQLGLQNLVFQHNDVVLPKLTVPTFSGEYSAWKTFNDIFKGAVDSKANLSNTQKFYYLSSFLAREAADLIKNIPVTNDTYAEAWSKLEQRYDRPHLVARAFIKGFMKLPTATTTNPKVLRKIIDGADECLRGLSAINIKERDPWLIFILLNKLDAETRHHWFEHIGSRTSLTIEEFLKYLDARFIHLESNELHTASATARNTSVRAHVTAATNGSSCAFCNGQHNISKCTEFIAASVSDRRKQVRSKSICFNCLKTGHRVKDCKSNFTCRKCNAKHHTLLHESTDKQESGSDLGKSTSQTHSNEISLQSSMDDALTSHHVIQSQQGRHVVLPTAMVEVKDVLGQVHTLRALIDTGSQVSFISEACVQRIGVSRSKARLHIKGISSSEAGMTKGCVNLVIDSQLDDSNVSVCAYILQRITADIPKYTITSIPWKKIASLKLADSKFNQSSPIDLLLGAEVAWNIITDGKIQIERPNLFAINSIFGWIISGQVDVASGEEAIASYTATIDVDELLKKFWDLDECKPISKHSEHDDPAEIHFRKTTTRSTDGKYVVELPFKDKDVTFRNTLQGAVQRLMSMERRFHNNAQLQQEYVKFMQEYMLLGHMQQMSSEDIHKSPQYYLPHHAVVKPDSSTTRLRVVFDGSHKDADGKSLNEQLLIGPPIQRDLFGVSLRFRQFKYVFIADITKMFRQIWVSPIHQDFQRIVWRESPNESVKHYRLCTVTYGTASAPFLSVRVLQQLAHDNIDKFPQAARIIENNIYVDDVMAGGDTIDDVMRAKTELTTLLESGGFHLRKWSSNSSTILQTVPVEDYEVISTAKIGNSSNYIKILGLYWNPKSDKYSFHVKATTVENTTKRHILSEIARIFDIFGFLAPVVVNLKILFQKVWLTNVNWDDTVPDHIRSTWRSIRETLHCLEEVSIPRNIFTSSSTFELHCFCDASTSAYACVVYSVCIEGGIRSVTMIAAKTRVAPLRAMSIPRLELCAALLLARLYNSIKTSLNRVDDVVYAWTDSQVVLHWLSSPPRNWKMFVGNRTEEILDCLPRNKWNYIDTKENPADCASRGITPDQLLNHNLWWSGPTWLQRPHSDWPSKAKNENLEFAADLLERRKIVLHTVTRPAESSILVEYAVKVSSFSRLIHVIAYVLRFISKLKNKDNTVGGQLQHKELQQAQFALFSAIQHESFEDTFQRLTNKSKKKDKLMQLSPFIDSSGVLRVGGRIDRATVSYNIKHPIILPKHHVSRLVIEELHKMYLHVGVNELFVIVRQRYWIVGARNIIRSVVHQCKQCFMLRKQTATQRMADLPAVRLEPARPFLNSGCDFAGPINIKMTNCKRPRICKSYICLFICLSTKAIHIELVTDLSAEAFIAAFKRFTSRRGKCGNLYTDNGTNFHGANRLLTDMHKSLLKESFNHDIYSHLAKDGTTWHFIPPSSPHFGGIWESNVKSIKYHLRRVMGESLLSFEDLYTLLTQIEAILNSRPLCTISDADHNPLTPSHFLIGEPLIAVPEPTVSTRLSLKSSWNHIRNMAQGFWKRWNMEYITSLQRRTKWTTDQPNLAVGKLVVIKDPNVPPAKWSLGIVEEVHPGSDGTVRVVTIRTEKGTYKRPITKVALLPTSD